MQHEVQRILRSVDLKVTPQRAAILRILMESKDHPGVEDLYKEIKQEHPSISLATVYKTVYIFKEKGLVQELPVSFNKVAYDGNVDFHPHLVCSNCNAIEDIPSLNQELPDVWFKEASSGHGYHIASTSVILYGVCPDCQKDKVPHIS